MTVTTVPVATVTVAPASLSLTVGQTGQLTATLRDAGGNTLTGRTVTWSSNQPSQATVSGSGLVTAVGAGTATITATSEGQSGTASVTVTTVPVATVTVAPASLSLAVGQTGQLTATLRDAGGEHADGADGDVELEPAVAGDGEWEWAGDGGGGGDGDDHGDE